MSPGENEYVRIGIDVGGTFTHAVALNSTTLELIGKSKVPTTHSAKQGVAKGIIDSLKKLLIDFQIDPSAVSFIAHSTTQATNALLEGDVVSVGILGLGAGASAQLSNTGTKVGSIELAKGKYLKTFHKFIDITHKPLTEETIKKSLQELISMGAAAIAVSEAFAVDNPSNEELVMSVARSMHIPVTSGSEVSKLYGLKARTVTAVINAAMLPKMIETADMTEKSVRESGITAPIMIMRSDGGVMDIEAMRARPILTRLSGPAAGVAAAMMYLNITDGIFLEVGGTSTDISVIRNGKALVKNSEIAGRRIYLRSLDVNTIGVAGGSMIRLHGNEIKEVGPRSAHIAGCGYVSFAESFDNAQIELISPKPDDPADYLAFKSNDTRLCLTPTCAANYLDLVPEGDCAKGNKDFVEKAFQLLANKISANPKQAAEKVLTLAYEKCLPAIKSFIREYKLNTETLTLVGGGGGASALTPFIAEKLSLRHEIAIDADVLSAIGVALALVRETVERNIIQPKQEDILQVREEAYAAVSKMGADPSSIEVFIEVDSRTNLVRATAYGAVGLTKKYDAQKTLSEQELISHLAASMRISDTAKISKIFETKYFRVFACNKIKKELLGIFRQERQSVRVVDERGVIRYQSENSHVKTSSYANVAQTIENLAEEMSVYGDAGRIIPNIILLIGSKIIDLSGLSEIAQIIAVARAELDSVHYKNDVIVIANIV